MKSTAARNDIQYEPEKTAVIYARFSSSGQREESIEGQLRVCKDYAERNGYQIVGEYIDRAISGRSDDRPDFQRMISDARTGGFKYVLVYKLDRFARNRYDSAIYKVQLKKYGVKVISCMENIGDNPESIILEAVLEASAEYYSIDLSQKVKRGLTENARKGYYLNGFPPIGYKLVDKHLIPDPDVALHITWAFKAYADGMLKKDIVEELNARGVRSRKGGLLTASSLQTVFKNEKYLGILDQLGYRFENCHEPLIDKETFDKVQDMIKSNQHYGARTRANTPYLLTGKLFCGMCGSPMRGVSGTGRNGKIWYYYSCKGRKEKHCKKRHENKDFIEWYVCEQTVQLILQPDVIRKVASEMVRIYNADFGNSQVKEMEKRISRIDSKINKIVDMLIDVPDAGRKPLYEKLEAASQEKTALEQELAKLKIANHAAITEDKIIDWLKRFCKGDLMSMEFRERIIDTLVSSVYLFDDKVVIYYYFDNRKQISYIDMLRDVEDGAPSPDEELPDPSGNSGVRIMNEKAERVGFEPTRPCGQTVFKTASL